MRLLRRLATLALVVAAGCTPPQPPRLAVVAELSDRDAEVIEALIRADVNKQDPKRVYFLTVTPIEQWGRDGKWLDLPADFHARIADLPIRYHAASQAYLRDRKVFRMDTDEPGWMRWITINRWISDNQVEVQSGVWTSRAGGRGSTHVYEKTDGRWRIKRRGESWAS